MNNPGEEPLPEKELPPMEQFAMAVSELESKMPGLIKAEPKKVTREQIEEILRPRPKPQEIPAWVKKIFEWITNLIKRLNEKKGTGYFLNNKK